MQIARVIGDIVSTVKDPNLEGLTLLVVQPLGSDRSTVGRPLVAVDSVGAGVGEEVFFVRGREASFPFHPREVPTDAAIVGIIDELAVEPAPPGTGTPDPAGSQIPDPAGSRTPDPGSRQDRTSW